MGKKTIAGAAVIAIVVVLVLLLLLSSSTTSNYLLIAGAEPKKRGDSYGYSIYLLRDTPYYQTFRLGKNYSLDHIDLFVAQLNKSIGLYVFLSEYDRADPMNSSNVTDIGMYIIQPGAIPYNMPTWVSIRTSDITLYKNVDYKITVIPYPEQPDDGGGIRWLLSDDSYENGQMYIFTHHQWIEGPLCVETDAAFRLWGRLID